MGSVFSNQKKTSNHKEANKYPLRYGNMVIAIMVFMSAGHDVPLSLD